MAEHEETAKRNERVAHELVTGAAEAIEDYCKRPGLDVEKRAQLVVLLMGIAFSAVVDHLGWRRALTYVVRCVLSASKHRGWVELEDE